MADVPAVEGSDAHAAAAVDVAIFCVGSTGDVQPFVALAAHLARRDGLRVLLATHAEYRGLVESQLPLLASSPSSSTSPDGPAAAARDGGDAATARGGSVVWAEMRGSIPLQLCSSQAGKDFLEAKPWNMLAKLQAFFKPLCKASGLWGGGNGGGTGEGRGGQ